MNWNLQAAIQLLVDPRFIFGYSAFLLLAFVFFSIRLYWKYSRILRDLRSARRVLEGAGDEGSFFEGFSAYDESLSSNRSIGHVWTEFTESFVYPGPNEPQLIRNAKEPSSHFDLVSLVEPHINIRGYNAIPNYLTGLGILGTFIGLAAGIGLAEPYLSNAATQDTAQVATGLRFLLRGASLAFITSIVGLSTSITFLFFERSRISKLARQIGRWNKQLDSVLELATPEKLANEQLRELKQQTTQLKQFNTDLATSIAAALDEKLAGRLGPTLEKLIEGVEGLREDRHATSEGMVESMVEQLKETMTGAAGRELSAMAGTLETLGQTLAASTSAMAQREAALEQSMAATRENLRSSLEDSLASVQEQVSSSIGEMTSRLDSSIEAMGAALELAGVGAAETFGAAMGGLAQSTVARIEDLLASIAESGTTMTGALHHAGREAAAAVDESARRMQEQALQSEELIGTLRDASDRLSSLMTQVAESESGFRAVAPQLRAASEAFVDASRKTRESLHAIESLASQTTASSDALKQTQEKLQEAWDDHVTRFEGTDAALSRVFSEIESGLERFVGRVSEFNAQFDRHMSTAVGQLGGAVTELGELLEENLEMMTRRSP